MNKTCWRCRGTGAANPDAGESMDFRDYLPCTACDGTGFSNEYRKVLREKADELRKALKDKKEKENG